jgi:hypothetical protein
MSTPIGDQIARAAVDALADTSVVDSPHHCQMFVREVCERVGGVARQVMDAYRASSAELTLVNFEHDGRYIVWDGTHSADPELVAGDILYKGRELAGPDGHTGIVFHNLILGKPVLCVAENSTYQIEHPDHAVDGAKGWRTLHEFGPFNAVVRLSV